MVVMSVTQVIPMLITSDWLAVRHSGSDQFSKQFNYQREQRPHRKLKLDVRREENGRAGRLGRWPSLALLNCLQLIMFWLAMFRGSDCNLEGCLPGGLACSLLVYSS